MEFKYCIVADALYGDKTHQTPVKQKQGRLTVYNFSDDELLGIIRQEDKKMNDNLPLELKSTDGKVKH